MKTSVDIAISLLKKHEGFSAFPYQCPTGHLTIGYGTNLEAGISETEAHILLQMRVENAKNELMSIFGYQFLSQTDPARIAVLIDMLYNLGMYRFGKFKKFIQAIKSQDYEKAADEMLKSKWANQVKNRAIELAEIMRSGHV